MAFRATNEIPVDAYPRAKRLAAQAKRLGANRAASFASSGATSEQLKALSDNALSFRTELNASKGVPGIVAYALAQEDDAAYPVGAEFNAVIASIDQVIQAVADLPGDDDADWRTPRVFTAGELTDLIAALNAVDSAVI